MNYLYINGARQRITKKYDGWSVGIDSLMKPTKVQFADESLLDGL